jgi:hypothetical protein
VSTLHLPFHHLTKNKHELVPHLCLDLALPRFCCCGTSYNIDIYIIRSTPHCRTNIFSFPHPKYHFILLLLQYIYYIFHERTTHLHVGSLDGAFFAHSNVAFSSVFSVSELVPTRKLILFRLRRSRYSPASSTTSPFPIEPLSITDQLQKIKH